ncbi:MAG: hypothetical protein ACLU80_17235 [Dorea sp.]
MVRWISIQAVLAAYLEIHQRLFLSHGDDRGLQKSLCNGQRMQEDLAATFWGDAHEKLGKKADREVVHQYIQHWKIAKDFANYLELYRKYKKDYGLEKIMEGV